MLCPQKKCLSLYFRKNLTCLKCWSDTIWQDFSVSVVYDKLLYVLADSYEQEHTMTATQALAVVPQFVMHIPGLT